MSLTIPDPSLVVLVGPAGAGKSTFAAKQFLPTEIVLDSVAAVHAAVVVRQAL